MGNNPNQSNRAYDDVPEAGGGDRIPTQVIQEYSSVQVHSDDDDVDVANDLDADLEEDEDHEAPRPRRLGGGGGGGAQRRRQQRRFHPRNISHFFVGYLHLVVFLILGVAGAGLWWYRSVSLHRHGGGGPSEGTTDGATTTTSSSSSSHHTVHYDPQAGHLDDNWNPYDYDYSSSGSLVTPPKPPFLDSSKDSSSTLGFLHQPHLTNNVLVFVTQGDIYLTVLQKQQKPSKKKAQPLPAMKLTTTVGNVGTPMLHPTLPLIAFTATYTAYRELYLLDLSSSSQPAMRLTYSSDHLYGISQVVGWKKNNNASSPATATIVYAAHSNVVSLPDVRLYELSLVYHKNHTSSAIQVLQQEPVPLAQAIDGVYHHHHHHDDDDDDDNNECLYFTRFKQSSRTIRYVGGTAESLWLYCDGDKEAVRLFAEYNGTTKEPSVATYGDQDYLLFLSDRRDSNTVTTATSMNLFAVPISKNHRRVVPKAKDIILLTRASCFEDGRAVQEYTVDPVTNHVVLRIGADLHFLSSETIVKLIQEKKTTITSTEALPIRVYSDFHQQQERLIVVKVLEHLKAADVFETAFDAVNVLLTVRGQTWVLPVIPSLKAHTPYQGAGQNLPPRRYRVVPGAQTGGSIRVLTSRHVPLPANETTSQRRLAVVLATDPRSPTAEHAFYLVEIQSDAVNTFAKLDDEYLQKPFLGGHVNGGSTKDGGLGSVLKDTVTVSPCGRRMAWADTDGRICVMTLPVYNTRSSETSSDTTMQSNTTMTHASYTVLPSENELGEPLVSSADTELSWSPGGRYLAVKHSARNQFSIISIVDCGDPQPHQDNDTVAAAAQEESDDAITVADIQLGRAVQATPSRFNSMGMFWGKTSLDFYLEKKFKILSELIGTEAPDDVATTLFFLTDRDIVSDVNSPWGSRAPAAHFPNLRLVYALPLQPKPVDGKETDSLLGRFAGGGALEVFVDDLNAFQQMVEDFVKKAADKESARRLREEATALAQALRSRRLSSSETASVARFLDSAVSDDDAAGSALKGNTTASSAFPKDMDIDFGATDLSFARRAYRLAHIPKGKYIEILSQLLDDPSLVLIAIGADEKGEPELQFQIYSVSDFPGDGIEPAPVKIPGHKLKTCGLSTTRKHIYIVYDPEGATKVVANMALDLASFLLEIKTEEIDSNFADTSNMAISVWPALEYKQMYNDAWRMLRDYFYDRGMHGVDWPAVHKRYLPLVERCSKREELDDVMAQMASELSALHVFVYGGEYDSPLGDDKVLKAIHTPASLGVGLIRSPGWKGYRITEIPHRDPDFNLMDDDPVFCPLSDQTLRITGQKGLEVGDVIVGINGESVMQVPDINMMLRGMAGRSVRLEVLRLTSGTQNSTETAVTEPVIITPISPDDASDLRYKAWEWKTRQKAKELAAEAGFTVAYIHMQSMSRDDVDAFARNFFPDYDKQALILDVRHNRGGNIDSWILSILQRKAWMYWKDRNDFRSSDLDWDEQFAFRGHIVVLIDEHTASDGEGVSRGLSELGLGRLIGMRTWGGGIWLSSDNHLVDGGIATAPEVGTFNDKFGWGLEIEQHGVVPDIEVDNNPRSAFDGEDTQLERAIAELKRWLDDEPVIIPNPPKQMPDMSLHEDDCPA